MCARQSVAIQGHKFYLVRQIGEGYSERSDPAVRDHLSSRSFSYVFEARNTSDTHPYAVKKMSCHTAEEEKRARDEVANYQRFTHPNLGSIQRREH